LLVRHVLHPFLHCLLMALVLLGRCLEQRAIHGVHGWIQVAKSNGLVEAIVGPKGRETSELMRMPTLHLFHGRGVTGDIITTNGNASSLGLTTNIGSSGGHHCFSRIHLSR